MSVLGTNTGMTSTSFSRAPGMSQNRLLSVPSRFQLVLTITVLPRIIRLDRLAGLQDLPRCVKCRAKLLWCRNINLLPFRAFRLRMHLGSTNPRLTIIVEEPLPLRRNGFSPFFAATPTRILIGTRSTGAHAPASAHAPHLPTRYHC